MADKERRYFFIIPVGGSKTKTQKISVKESKLTDKQKMQIYEEFMEYFDGLPAEVSTRFMKAVITNINKQIENKAITENLKTTQQHAGE